MALFKKETPIAPQQGGQVNTRETVAKFWDAVEGRRIEDKLNNKSLRWFVATALLVISIIYINYQGMFKVRQLSNLNRELTELRIEEMTISTELMNSRRLSTIETRLEAEDIKIEISKTSPILIK